MASQENSVFSEVSEETFEEVNSKEESEENYKVESWPEEDDNPTGFKIKGKFVLGKALEVMKVRLKKSKIIKKLNQIEYVVTEVRTIKHGTEVEVELKGKEKGGACLRFFGPNKKKEYTLVINKLKKFDEKFVKIVTMELAIPIIDDCISVMADDDVNQSFLCNECGKRLASEKTLKVHIEKLHLKVAKADCLKRKEISVLKGSKNTLKGFRSLKSYACANCEYNSVDIDQMKRHERDVHKQQLSVISPKSKKVKNDKSKDRIGEIEPMEIDVKSSKFDVVMKETEKTALEIDFNKIMKEINNLRSVGQENNRKIMFLTAKVEELSKSECSKCHRVETDSEGSSGNAMVIEEAESLIPATDEKDEVAEPLIIITEDSDKAAENTIDSKYTCNNCSFQTNEDWRLQKHIRVGHKNGCDMCEDVFDSKSALITHKKGKHIDKISLCINYLLDKCIFSKEECDFLHAEKEKKSAQVIECSQCQNKFTQTKDLEDHMQLHTEQNSSHECAKCNNRFANTNELEDHMKLHMEEDQSLQTNKFKCEKCDTLFDTYLELINHKKYHTQFIPCKNMPNCKYKDACYYSHAEKKENEFPCFECGNKFGVIKELMIHRKEKHSINECKKFLEGKCTYNENSCWYNHTSKSLTQVQGFQKASQQIKQPIELLLTQNQQMIANMMGMMKQLTTVLSQKN